MPDDLDALEQRLDDLQAELAHDRGQILKSSIDRERSISRSDPPDADGDPLDRFGEELRRLAAELVGAWDRVVVHERGRGATRRVELETDADLHALAVLERALAASPEVAGVALRAYSGGRASLVVTLG